MKLSLFCFIFLSAVATLASGQDTKRGEQYQKLLVAQEEYYSALSNGDSLEIAERSYILGKRYIALTNYSLAKRYLLQALKIRKKHDQYEDMGKIYSMMGRLELTQDNSDAGRLFYRLAIENFIKSGTERGLLNSYNARLDLLTWRLKVTATEDKSSVKTSADSLFLYSQLMIKVCHSLKDTANMGIAYKTIGTSFLLKNKPNESVQYFKKALSILQSASKAPAGQILDLHFDLANAYLSLGKTLRAEEWSKGATTIVSNQSNFFSYWQNIDAHEALASYFQKTNSRQKAQNHKEKAEAYRKKEYQAYRQAAEEGLQLFFDNEEKQIQLASQKKELILQQQNSEIKTWLSMLIALFLLAATIIGIFFYRLSRKYQTLSKQNADLLDEQNHRIKNNLQSVKDLLELQSIRISDPKALQALEESVMRVEAVARVHHGLYDGGRLVEVELKKYIPELVKGVMDAYARKDIKISYELDDIWLHAEKAIPIGLILNELTTNSCKYAFNSIAEAELEISCRLHDDEIRFVFSDNGTGFDTEKHDGNDGSFGLRLITLLSGKLKGKGQFNAKNGTRYTVTFKSGTRK